MLHNLRSRNVTPCDKLCHQCVKTNGLLCNVYFAFLCIVLDTCMGSCEVSILGGFVVVLYVVSPSFIVVVSIYRNIPQVTPLSRDDMLITSELT